MSKNFQDNAGVLGMASMRGHYATSGNGTQFTLGRINHLKQAGLRERSGSKVTDTQQMFNRDVSSPKYRTEAKAIAQNVKKYLANKEEKQVNPRSQGQYYAPKHGSGMLKAGLKGGQRGAMVGGITTTPFPILHNGLRVMRGEISAREACIISLRESASDAGAGSVSALTVTTVMAACPPIAIALTTISPKLLAAGGSRMVKQFFWILESHKEKTKAYYGTLSQHDLDFLDKLEADLKDEYQKKLQKIEKSRALLDQLSGLPIKPGVAVALKRYRESVALAQAHGVQAIGAKVLLSESQYIC